jgi:Tol biopolymer transport system component/imidazolonepropionase-like amidohydrolase
MRSPTFFISLAVLLLVPCLISIGVATNPAATADKKVEQEKGKKKEVDKATKKETAKETDAEPKGWDIESPPGPKSTQTIDVDEGTWVTVDVSPDGNEIAFDLLGDLYTMPITGADGTNGVYPKKLTSGVAWDMQPRYSPDGKRIAFTSDRRGKSTKAGDNIWTIESSSKKLRQITDETYRLMNGPAWTPAGDYIVARKHFSSRRSLGAGEMWLYHSHGVDAGSTAGLQLTKRPTDQKDVNEPIFSPDGKYLYYSQDATGGKDFEYDKDSNKQIYVVKRLTIESGETESYITGPGGACRPTPSPDGKQIAFVRRIGAKTGLHIFDTRSGAVRLVYDKLERDMQEAWAIHGVYSSFAWLPDGKSIVVWAKGKIRRIRVSDGADQIIPFRIKDKRTITKSLRFPIEVAPENVDIKMLRWVETSPNGNMVTYQALGNIYIRELPDGKPRRLTTQEVDFEFCPSFSRDGQYIVYTTWNDETLGTIRVASTNDAAENWVVTKTPGHYSDPVFTPNGKLIVFQRRGGGHLTSPLWSRDQGIYKVSSKGGKAELISKSGRSPQFASDNDRVFLLKSKYDKAADNLQLYSIDMDGREERVHYTSSWASDYRVSPDGKWLSFIERFNVYVAPFVKTGSTISVGPGGKGIPIAKVSQKAGNWIHFAGNSKAIHWTLGPDLYTKQLADAFTFLQTGDKAKDEEDDKADVPTVNNISFTTPHAKPMGMLALVGARIATMVGDKIIEDGTVLIDGNRIVALGPRKEVVVPADARVIQLKGQTVLPGFIDVHAHGSQATGGITPQRNWIDYARLAFGVTTVHDPSNDTNSIFAASEMAKTGRIISPRTFSTGTILYGATGGFKAEIDSLEDAKFHLERMKAVGAFSVKSYNQPRRDQRQQVIAAARELQMMVVPEGGSTFMHNMNMIVDGHTGIEHTLPVQTAYDDVMDLWRGTGVGYTPTLCVAYGGISGEQYWYEVDDLWLHPRLQTFIPPHVLVPRSRRRNKAPIEDYNHIKVAEIARQIVDDDGLVQAGGHGQLNGMSTHWELWSFVQGGMTPMQSLRCGTINGAKYLGLDGDIGSLEVGKLADIVVIQRGYDPTEEIRHTEKVEYVVANGRIFDARQMNELGSPEPRRPFYWHLGGHGISGDLPRSTGCGCHRPGGAWSWQQQ